MNTYRRGTIARDVAEKYRHGAILADDELAIAAAYWAEVEVLLTPLGEMFHLQRNEASRLEREFHSFIRERKL